MPETIQLNHDDRVLLARSATAGAVAGAALLSTQPANAQDANAITEMTNGVNSLNGIYTSAVPIVVGVIIFSAGAMILKRLVFS